MTTSNFHVRDSYRRLYRHGLRAVQYSVPGRYVVRDELRQAFRSSSAKDFDREKINATVAFLKSATKETGTANKILKNLIHAWWWEWALSEEERDLRRNSLQHFNITIKMFNESMGMCLPDGRVSRTRATAIPGTA
ncbi:hypothetical protein MMC07_007587 [Pseudocyphellaria aurata]|nr:hypothetical protein [Pseudocyphellaria aurata]